MDISTRKILFIQEFLKLKNEEVISSLERIIQKESKSKKAEYQKQLNKAIDQSMEDSKNDRVMKASDLKSKYGK